MMRKHITLIIMLLFSLGVKAQLVVEPGSFKEVPGFVILDHDKTDINDVPFAVIKIRTQNIDDKQRRELTFGGNLAVDTDLQYKVGEVWLYLTYHADYIKISHPDFSSTEFTFPYDMKPNGCYELTLVNNFNPGLKSEADMGGQYFVLTVSPATANVYVDGDLRTTTDGELTIMLPYGEHKYRIEAPSFVGDEGTFTIGKTKVTKTVTLVSAQAQLTLSCGDSSAELYLNDKKIGTGSWNGSLDAGMYIVEARRAGHSTVRQSLTLAKQERRSLTLDAPKPIYGKLNLNSTPGNCDVYLDGKKIGTSPDIFSDVLIGTHSIELRKEGYENATKQVTIEENKIAQATVTLTKKQQTVVAGASGGSAAGNKTFTVNGVTFEMVAVKGGTFTMGGTSEQGSDADSDEKPTHSVTLSDYCIGKFEVTQELWEAVMGSNPSSFKGSKLPVEQVSWYEAVEFCNRLSEETGRRPYYSIDKKRKDPNNKSEYDKLKWTVRVNPGADGFRLPTEAEWEYAVRGGNKSRGYKYSGSNNINDVAWFWENSGDRTLTGDWDYNRIKNNNCKTHVVGTKSPNELGIHDMSGNVYEWCQDWYGDYSSGSQTNPQGPSSGSFRVLRGGSWNFRASRCRVSYRGSDFPYRRFNNYGLRLALVL